jgi:hypothetical protein
MEEERMLSHQSALRRLVLLIALFAIPALACQFSASTARITEAVMATAVEGDNFDPVGVTDTYPADQPEFHAVVSVANAPGDTLVKAVWIAVDVGSAAEPGTTIDETQVSVEGSRNVHFSLTPNAGGWPPGKYKVDIYLNDQLDRSLTFTVAGVPEAEAAVPEPSPTLEPTATALPTPTPSPETPETEPSPELPAGSEGIIANAVMAMDVTVLTAAPVGITDVFPPGQGIVHAVITLSDAPSGTSVKAVWTAVDVGDAAPPNTELGDYETDVEGSRNLDFSFQAGSDGFPPGTYKVDIHVNGSPERTLTFSVAEEGANIPALSTPISAPVGSCPPLPAPDYQPSGFLTSIVMAQDTQGDNFEPVNPGRVFTPDATFHAVATLENAPDNTEVTAMWFVEDVGSAEPCNTLITDPFTLTTSGSRNLDFTLQPPPGVQWPLGRYRVEVYVNGNLDLDVTFTVE